MKDCGRPVDAPEAGLAHESIRRAPSRRLHTRPGRENSLALIVPICNKHGVRSRPVGG
jgi:hypothetical protein